ncbi:MAG TPA: IgGFc-binding protein [Nannocystaceae bacterium]|nr:IgGFc-binding protein [Nannocystaceae bacterium]
MRRALIGLAGALACGGGGGTAVTESGSVDETGDGPISSTSADTAHGPTTGASTTSSTSSADDEETVDPDVLFDVKPPGPVDLGPSKEGPVIPENCSQASDGESTVGCRFYAVDLDQYDTSENDQWAIAVSNVQLSGDVDVVVEQKVGGVWEIVAGPQAVPPIGLYTFELPDKHHEGSGVMAGGTYRVSADRPIIAYQFSPLLQTSATSDASMLYPATSLDTLFFVPHWGGGQGGNGYVTIVAVEDGTTIEVTPTANTMSGTGVPAGTAGNPFMVSLDEGDIAEVMVTSPNVSLAGTRVESNAGHPIAVFTAHECANIPADVFACDHLEEQLAGVRLWGQDFAAARVPVRSAGTPETSLWQIHASENGTTITLSADDAVTGLPSSPAQLDRGETLEFYASGSADQPGDFMIHATKPIAVMNYMCGADNPPGSGTGDPAMVQLSPTQQFLPRYVVLVPNEWTTDVLVITRPAGVDISLDGVDIDDAEFRDIDNGQFEVARVIVPDGVHTLAADEGFAVMVVGYDEYDSYAYLGGSGTGKINPDPQG